MANLPLDSAGPEHDQSQMFMAKACSLELQLGVEPLVSNRSQNEQGAGFGDSVVEDQALLLSPIFSQHPAPLHVGLSMPLVAFIGKTQNCTG